MKTLKDVRDYVVVFALGAALIVMPIAYGTKLYFEGLRKNRGKRS